MYTLEAFQPGKHATSAAAAYPGRFVVTSNVALNEIVFHAEDDELARFVGVRDANACPIGTHNLIAAPEQPPIQGAEQRQHLTAICAGRISLLGTNDVTAYPLCIPKAIAAGYKPDTIPMSAIVNSQDIKCPFQYLSGFISDTTGSQKGRVEVAVDVHGMDDSAALRTI